jgi:OOP family OmpA-OmpF porin
MKRVLLFGLIVVLAAIAFPSQAQAGFIFGAGTGTNRVNIDEDFDESDLGWKVFAGFRFIPYFGLEAQYIDFGNPENDDIAVELNDAGIFAIGAFPIGEHFELYGKGGYTQWRIEQENNATSDFFDDEDWDFAWGGGMAFIIGKHVGIRLEYERLEIQDTDIIDMGSVGVDFRF